MTDAPRHPLVLVVDDDPDTRELYHIMLESVGYDVASAGTVRAGLELAKKKTPHVVITDWRLPDGDGLAVADGLREHHTLRHVPLIAVTGVSMTARMTADVRARGFTGVLVKPASPDDILHAVRAAAEIGTAHRLRAATRRLGRYASQASRHNSSRGSDAAPTGLRTIDADRLLTRAAERSGNDITLVLADDSARYVAAAGSARDLTGYEPRELISLSVWDLAPPPETRSGQGLWQSFIASGTQEGRYILRRRDGAPVEAQYCAVANVVPGLHLSAIARASQLPEAF
jgi:PAS domain S-box-containing protein